MRLIYSFVMYLLAPFILLRLYWKSRKLPPYRKRIAERFCMDDMTPRSIDVWLHAVSLGEVIAATPLAEALLAKGRTVLVTTMTPTGAQRVRDHFAERVMHRYVPYDLNIMVRRFYKTYKPRVGIIMETELWPNLIAEAHRIHMPLLLVNARLSEQSCRGYQRFKCFFKPLLNQFNHILAQSEDDAKRYKSLGVDEARVKVFGNIKFDLVTTKIVDNPFASLKKQWGENREVVLFASTHEGEDAQILTGIKRLIAAIPGLIILIVPRHPERFNTVFDDATQRGFKVGRRSELSSIDTTKEIIIIDSIGELSSFYQLSDYAFVGGSLVPVGGHNVLEPIAMGVPVLSGKYVHNFKSIISDLESLSAIVLVNSVDELVDQIIFLHTHIEKRQALVAKATTILEKNKGALERYSTIIESYF